MIEVDEVMIAKASLKMFFHRLIFVCTFHKNLLLTSLFDFVTSGLILLFLIWLATSFKGATTSLLFSSLVLSSKMHHHVIFEQALHLIFHSMIGPI